MARLDEARERADGEGRSAEDQGRGRRVAVLCAIAAIAVGFAVWAVAMDSGVELERSSDDGLEEPLDPESTVEGGTDVGEASTEQSQVDGAAGEEAESVAAEPLPAIAKVHVDGAVMAPGVYELSGEDPRVADAVAAAGGLTDEADTSAVNLAAQVHDADKIHIPKVEEAAAPVESAGEVPAGSSTVSSPEAPAANAGGDVAAGPININTATAEELTALPGIGEKTAQKIVDDREAQGPFASIEDLMRVSGIGEKKFAQVRDLICA